MNFFRLYEPNIRKMRNICFFYTHDDDLFRKNLYLAILKNFFMQNKYLDYKIKLMLSVGRKKWEINGINFQYYSDTMNESSSNHAPIFMWVAVN
jgi:hypothetical protein